MLTKQALWDMQNWLLPPDSLQGASILGIDTQPQCIDFLHAEGSRFSHQSPVGLSVAHIQCSPATIKDSLRHSPSHLALQQGQEAKKLGHLRNYREEGPVVNKSTEQSPDIFGSSGPQAATVWRFCWKQSEVIKIGHISNWDTEHRCPGHTEMEQIHSLPSSMCLVMPFWSVRE